MPRYKLHWIRGGTEIIEGESIEKAFMLAGHGGGSFKSLDYYEEVRQSFNLEFKGPLVVVRGLNTQNDTYGQTTIINTAKLQRVECSDEGSIIQSVCAYVKRKKDNQEVELRISCGSYQEASELRDLLIKLGRRFNPRSVTKVITEL